MITKKMALQEPGQYLQLFDCYRQYCHWMIGITIDKVHALYGYFSLLIILLIDALLVDPNILAVNVRSVLYDTMQYGISHFTWVVSASSP